MELAEMKPDWNNKLTGLNASDITTDLLSHSLEYSKTEPSRHRL